MIRLLLVAWAAQTAAFDPDQEAKRLGTAPLAIQGTQSPSSVRVALLEGAGQIDLRLEGVWSGGGEDWTGTVRFSRKGRSVRMVSADRSSENDPVESASVLLSGGERFCLGTRCFRGTARVVPSGEGLALVDELGLEDYLLGVVPGEIGRHLDPRYLEAVKAQAVVARTYALRSLGQYPGKPWDVRDDVRDQVYGGASGEDPLCSRAVRATRGQILTDDQGSPVDAYYHATSGGHTADIAEVWPRKGLRPYLCGVADTAPDGRAWGCTAPSAAWTETWSVRELHQAVRRDLSEALGRKVDPGEIVSLRLEGRDASDRARKLVVVGKSGTFEVVGDRIRWALRRPGKGRPILRSTRFELRREDDRYVAEGTGNGHGVGLSQNGAMGRAWAGQSCEQILHSYYPGTILRTTP